MGRANRHGMRSDPFQTACLLAMQSGVCKDTPEDAKQPVPPGADMRKFAMGLAARAAACVVVVVVSELAFLAASSPVHANGGSGDSISAMPSSGPVGVHVSLALNVTVTSATTYQLGATTTSPDQGGCANAQPMTGVSAITVNPPIQGGGGQGGTNATIQWPANLGRGQYWLCAQPTSGDGQPVSSSQPFTVLTDAAPSVTLAQPPGAIVGGTQLRATVGNWMLPDNSAPQLYLLSQGDPIAQAVSMQSLTTAVSSDPSKGQYVLTVKIPTTLDAGSYSLLAEGLCANSGCAVIGQSPVFLVTVATTSTAAPSAHPRSTLSRFKAWLTDSKTLPVKAGILLLLLLITSLTVIPLARRSRKPKPPRRSNNTAPRQYRQW